MIDESSIPPRPEPPPAPPPKKAALVVEVVQTSAQTVKQHRCSRCNEVFGCPTPADCKAGFAPGADGIGFVLPTIRGADGNFYEHCLAPLTIDLSPTTVSTTWSAELVPETVEYTPVTLAPDLDDVAHRLQMARLALERDALDDAVKWLGDAATGVANVKAMRRTRASIVEKVLENFIALGQESVSPPAAPVVPAPVIDLNAPPCSACGDLMVRNGACYRCLNCGETSGCS